MTERFVDIATPTPHDLVATVTWVGPTACITVAGDVDCFTEPTLVHVADEVLARGATQVIVDLRSVDFLGAPGYWMLARTRARLAASGGSLQVVGAPAAAPDVARRVGLDIGVLSGADVASRALTSRVTPGPQPPSQRS